MKSLDRLRERFKSLNQNELLAVRQFIHAFRIRLDDPDLNVQGAQTSFEQALSEFNVLCLSASLLREENFWEWKDLDRIRLSYIVDALLDGTDLEPEVLEGKLQSYIAQKQLIESGIRNRSGSAYCHVIEKADNSDRLADKILEASSMIEVREKLLIPAARKYGKGRPIETIHILLVAASSSDEWSRPFKIHGFDALTVGKIESDILAEMPVGATDNLELILSPMVNKVIRASLENAPEHEVIEIISFLRCLVEHIQKSPPGLKERLEYWGISVEELAFGIRNY